MKNSILLQYIVLFPLEAWSHIKQHHQEEITQHIAYTMPKQNLNRCNNNNNNSEEFNFAAIYCVISSWGLEPRQTALSQGNNTIYCIHLQYISTTSTHVTPSSAIEGRGMVSCWRVWSGRYTISPHNCIKMSLENSNIVLFTHVEQSSEQVQMIWTSSAPPQS